MLANVAWKSLEEESWKNVLESLEKLGKSASGEVCVVLLGLIEVNTKDLVAPSMGQP